MESLKRFMTKTGASKPKSASVKANSTKVNQKVGLKNENSQTQSRTNTLGIGGIDYDAANAKSSSRAYTQVAKQDIRVSMDLISELKSELDSLSQSLHTNAKNYNLSNRQDAASSLEALYTSALSDENNNNNTDQITLMGKSNNELQINKMQHICAKLEGIIAPYVSKKDALSEMVDDLNDKEFSEILDEIDSKHSKDPLHTTMGHTRSDSGSEPKPALNAQSRQVSDMIGSFASDAEADDNMLNGMGNGKSTISGGGMDDFFGGGGGQNSPDPSNSNKKGGKNGKKNNGESTFNLFGDEIHSSPAKKGKNGKKGNNDVRPQARRQDTMTNFLDGIDSLGGPGSNPSSKTPSPAYRNESKSTHDMMASRTFHGTSRMQKPQDDGLRSKSLSTGAKVKVRAPNLLTDTEKERATQLAEERLEEIQRQFAVEDREREERQQAFDDHGDRIDAWEMDAKGVRRNLRTLLTSLQKVLWQDSGWKPISLASLVGEKQCKKYYRLACKLVHPDRSQQRGDSTERKAICERIFEGLNAAWDAEFGR